MPDSQDMTPLARIERQLDRLEDRTRDMITRADLDGLRREVVARDLLEPQLSLLKTQISQIDTARIADKLAFDKRLEEMEKDQISRQERFWARIGPIVAIIAMLLSFLQFFSHIQLR